MISASSASPSHPSTMDASRCSRRSRGDTNTSGRPAALLSPPPPRPPATATSSSTPPGRGGSDNSESGATPIVNCSRPFEPFISDFLMDDRKAGARVWAREKRALPPSSLFVCFSSCINSLTVRQHLVHAASRTFSSHNLIDLSIFLPMVSLDGRQTASIAV